MNSINLNGLAKRQIMNQRHAGLDPVSNIVNSFWIQASAGMSGIGLFAVSSIFIVNQDKKNEGHC